MKKLNENTAALRELREKTVHLKSSKAKLQVIPSLYIVSINKRCCFRCIRYRNLFVERNCKDEVHKQTDEI